MRLDKERDLIIAGFNSGLTPEQIQENIMEVRRKTPLEYPCLLRHRCPDFVPDKCIANFAANSVIFRLCKYGLITAEERNDWLEERKLDTQKEHNKGWDRVKKAVLERDQYKCRECGSTKDLEVHHMRLWIKVKEHKEEDLITLCYTCHRNHHKNPKPHRTK